jgi:hypothetical protein
MNLEGLGNNLPDGEAGIEGTVGILKNHLHLAPERAEVAFGEGEDVSAFKCDAARGGRGELENGAAHGGFPATALADKADRLAGLDSEGDVVNGTDVAGFSSQNASDNGKPSAQISNLQQGHG